MDLKFFIDLKTIFLQKKKNLFFTRSEDTIIYIIYY